MAWDFQFGLGFRSFRLKLEGFYFQLRLFSRTWVSFPELRVQTALSPKAQNPEP